MAQNIHWPQTMDGITAIHDWHQYLWDWAAR